MFSPPELILLSISKMLFCFTAYPHRNTSHKKVKNGSVRNNQREARSAVCNYVKRGLNFIICLKTQKCQDFLYKKANPLQKFYLSPVVFDILTKMSQVNFSKPIEFTQTSCSTVIPTHSKRVSIRLLLRSYETILETNKNN